MGGTSSMGGASDPPTATSQTAATSQTTQQATGQRGREWPPPVWRRPWVWVCGPLVLIIVAVAGTWWWQREEPRRVTEDFLQALVDGDLERAAELGPQPLWDPEHDMVQTVAIPALDEPDITGWSIDEIERHETWARVRVTIESASGENPAEFTVSDGQLSSVDYPSVQFQIPTLAGAIVVNGERVGLSNMYGMTLSDIGIGTIYLTPGTHTLTLPKLGEFVSSQTHTVDLAPDFSTTSSAEDLELGYELTAAGEDEVDRLFRELVEECAASGPPADSDCPITRDYFGLDSDLPDGTWEVLKWPEFLIEAEVAGDGWTVETVTDGEAVFTFSDSAEAGEQGPERPVTLSHWSRLELQPDGSLAFG